MKTVACSVGWRNAALAVLALAATCPAAPVLAARPKVGFDLSYTVACREVTSPEFAKLRPDEKIMEADLRVSVRIEQGDEQDLDHLNFEITSPAERLRVVDFVPRTFVESNPSEGVEVTKTVENTQSLGAGLGAAFTLGGSGKHGSINVQPLPSGNATTTRRQATTETTKRLPPGRVVVASGTLDNEHGVFFKLRASPTTSFEGTKPLSFRFVVPKSWRGDWVVLSAEAQGFVKRYLFKSIETCGQAKLFLALYEQGDNEAELAATDLAEAQQILFSGKCDGDCRSAVISELVTTARPWQPPARHKPRLPSPFKVCKACYLPFEPIDRVVSGRGERLYDAGEPRTWLKNSLERVAYFSDGSRSPNWQGD